MPDYKRGEIWQVDFDPQLGSEIAKRRPALIISSDGLNRIAKHVGVLIVVPGTTTRIENPKTGKLASGYCMVQPSLLNGLTQTTYFVSHQVKAISLFRLKEQTGVLETAQRKQIASDLATILGLYDDLGY